MAIFRPAARPPPPSLISPYPRARAHAKLPAHDDDAPPALAGHSAMSKFADRLTVLKAVCCTTTPRSVRRMTG